MPTDWEPWPGNRKAMLFIVLKKQIGVRLGACHGGCADSRQLLLNLFVDTLFGEFRRYANRILDGIGIRRSVSDEANALHAQQRRSAVLGVIQAFFEISKRAARKQIPDLAGDRSFERFFEGIANQVGYAFGNLQRDIAHETVSDDDIHFTVVQIASFNVADKIQRQLFEKLERVPGEFIALSFFFPYGKQTYAGTAGAEHGAKINLSHDGELLEIVRLAIHIRAHIQQSCGRTQRGRKNRGQRRTIHARDCAQNHFCRGHGGAGVAGGDESHGAALPHQAQTHAHGRIALGAHRLDRFVLHADDFAGMDDVDGQTRRGGMARQFRAEEGFGPDQQHANVAVPHRLNRAFDLGLWPAVRTHRVQSYDAWHGVPVLAGFLDFENFPALIVSAFRASPMRHLALMAVGTFGERVVFQEIVSAPASGPRLGVSPFWIWHLIPLLEAAWINVPACREYLLALTTADLPQVRRKSIVPGSDWRRTAGTVPGNPDGRWPSAEPPAEPARAGHLPATTLPLDNN